MVWQLPSEPDSFLLALSFPASTFAVCGGTSGCSSQGKEGLSSLKEAVRGVTTLQGEMDVLSQSREGNFVAASCLSQENSKVTFQL